MTEKYSIVYVYHDFFIPLSLDWHLGCFHVLAIVHSTAVNIGIHVSFSIPASSGYVLNHIVVLFQVFLSFLSFFLLPFFFLKEISILFSVAAVSIYILTNRARVFPFLHILSSIYCL